MMENSPLFIYVEDDAFNRKVLLTILTRVMGYPRLVLFEDSIDFMERLKAIPEIPDAIFLDIHVRPLNGFEMLALIRQDAAYDDCKIFAITASILPNEVERLQVAGFDGLIGKPLVARTFPDLLKRMMAGEKIWYIP